MSTPPAPVQEPLTLARLESILLRTKLIVADQPLKEESTPFSAGMDSLDLVEAFIEIELELGADIDDESLNITTSDTFAEIIRRVNAHLSGQRTAPATAPVPLTTEAQTCRLLWFSAGALLGVITAQVLLVLLIPSRNPTPNTNPYPSHDSWTPHTIPSPSHPKTSGNTWASTLLSPWNPSATKPSYSAGLSMASTSLLAMAQSSPLLKAIPIVLTLPAPSPEAGKSGSISPSLPSKADLVADPMALAIGGTLVGVLFSLAVGYVFR